MTNIKLQELLATYPDEMPVRLLTAHRLTSLPIDFTDENLLHCSDSTYVNSEAPSDEWDHEDGKIEIGEGQQYLLINPIIY